MTEVMLILIVVVLFVSVVVLISILTTIEMVLKRTERWMSDIRDLLRGSHHGPEVR